MNVLDERVKSIQKDLLHQLTLLADRQAYISKHGWGTCHPDMLEHSGQEILRLSIELRVLQEMQDTTE